jgi:hypothetical protein
MNYELRNEDYSVKNCLLWGVFAEHCKAADQARQGKAYGKIFKHAVLAALQLLPIIGQIVSLIEKLAIFGGIQDSSKKNGPFKDKQIQPIDPSTQNQSPSPQGPSAKKIQALVLKKPEEAPVQAVSLSIASLEPAQKEGFIAIRDIDEPSKIYYIQRQYQEKEGLTQNKFFESDFFIEKMAPQCKSHEELRLIIQMVLILMELIDKPENEPIVYQAISKIKLKDIFAKHPEIKLGKTLIDEAIKIATRHALEVAKEIFIQSQFGSQPAFELTDSVIAGLTERLPRFWHGTNSAYLPDIQVNGMKGVPFDENNAEMERLIKDLKRDWLFGWYKNQPTDKFYVTRNPSEAFHYAKGSPEWLQSFFCSFQTPPEYTSHYFSYEKRNGERVAQLFEESLKVQAERYKYSEKDVADLRAFYQKNWQRFGVAHPIILTFSHEDLPEYFRQTRSESQYIFREERVGKPAWEVFVEDFVTWSTNYDHIKIQGPIPPSKIRCFSFPPSIKLPEAAE